MLSFPIPAAQLLPHAPPMLVIDSLLNAHHGHAEAAVVLRPGHVLLHNGIVAKEGFVELAAQTAGAMKGYAEKVLGEPIREGFLAAAQDFSFLGEAQEGDALRISVCTTTELSGITALSATVVRDDAEGSATVLAQGKLKVFLPEKTPW